MIDAFEEKPGAPSTPLAEIRAQRLRKAAALREMGINPYPSRSARTHFAGPLVERYGEFEGQTVTVAPTWANRQPGRDSEAGCGPAPGGRLDRRTGRTAGAGA